MSIYLLVPVEDIEKINMELASLEDHTHGEEGEIITKLRAQKYEKVSISEIDILNFKF